MSTFYICFWLGWTLIICIGVGLVTWKIINLLKAILDKLITITRGEGEVWSDGYMTAEVMRKAENSLEKRSK